MGVFRDCCYVFGNVLSGVSYFVLLLGAVSYGWEAGSTILEMRSQPPSLTVGPDLVQLVSYYASPFTISSFQAGTYVVFCFSFLLLLLSTSFCVCATSSSVICRRSGPFTTPAYLFSWLGCVNWLVLAVRMSVLRSEGEELNCLPSPCLNLPSERCDWSPVCDPSSSSFHYAWWDVGTYLFAVLPDAPHSSFPDSVLWWWYLLGLPSVFLLLLFAGCGVWPRRNGACLEINLT